MARATWLWIGTAVLVVIPMRSADAANTNKTRVAPAFWGDRCIVTVDRSVDPVAHLGLAIPFEDDALTDDELPDSRRFQFFGLCEDHPVERELPNWVTMSDARRSLDAGLIEALPGADAVLESAVDWQSVGHDGKAGSCVVSINAAEARMPITCGDTAEGIAWDTTGVPAGGYVVRSYTFEPKKNLWARRPGAVRVVDGDDDPGPVVTLTAPRSRATSHEAPGFITTGCIAALPGTTVRLDYATASEVVAGNDDAWVAFSVLTPEEPTFQALFVPPPALVYEAVYLRAVATDPQGRTWIAHADHEIVVLPDCGQAEGSAVTEIADGCGIVPDGYEPPGQVVAQPTDCDYADGGNVDETTGGDDSSGSGEDTGGRGCTSPRGGGCSVGTPTRGVPALGWGLVLWMRRRGRRPSDPA